jgi:hypothetical protein
MKNISGRILKIPRKTSGGNFRNPNRIFGLHEKEF